jgi:hypothetical protein
MADVGTHHFVKSSEGVLVPQPSDDPNDPLVCQLESLYPKLVGY